jgi:endogenous inhibitor of DNA gyrase (YacG/DUF329 family)
MADAMRCPICKKPVEEPTPAPGSQRSAPFAAPASTFPFCSDRCKLIDLGRWLDGKYQVPAVEDDGDDA